MFDVAWSEILVVAVIAIIVVGPKELPSMLRAFGKTFGQVRRTAREFQSTFNEALREAERQAGLEDVKKDLDSVRKIDPTKDLKKSLGDTKKALGEKVTDAKFPHPDVVPLNGAGEGEAKPDGAAAAAAAETPQESAGKGTGSGEATVPSPAEDSTPRAAAGADRR